MAGEVDEPVGLDTPATLLRRALAQHRDGGPAQARPGVEVVGVPQLDALAVVFEARVGRLGAEALLGLGGELGQVLPALPRRLSSASGKLCLIRSWARLGFRDSVGRSRLCNRVGRGRDESLSSRSPNDLELSERAVPLPVLRGGTPGQVSRLPSPSPRSRGPLGV